MSKGVLGMDAEGIMEIINNEAEVIVEIYINNNFHTFVEIDNYIKQN